MLSVTAAEAVLDDSRLDLAASAVSHGHGVAPIELRLLENGRPIEVRRAMPAADGAPVREVFHVTASRDAPTVYTVEIPAAAGELVPENNTRSVLVQPPSRPRRVLLVQGAPGFEHSFLQRAWSGDRGLEIDSVVRKGKNEQGGDTFYIQAAAARSASLASGYPATREELFAYDAVVLANIEGAALGADQLEATRDFVGKRGGGLLVLGAQSFVRNGLADTALEDVLPLDLSDRGRGVLPGFDRIDARGQPRRADRGRRGASDHAADRRDRGDAQALGSGSRARVGVAARRPAARRERAGGDQRPRRRRRARWSRSSATASGGRWSSPARRRGAGG